jgi:hypothetical protein
MISSKITSANMIVLALAGLALLFAADNILPHVLAGFPPDGYWVGQIMGAALLGLANFNYFSRAALIGGIYGRAVTASNSTFYVVTALSLLRQATRSEGSLVFWTITAVCVGFAAIYSWLLYRGPFESDLSTQRGRLASPETNTTIRP